MQYLEALAAVGGLSKPSKMPGWSWSLSASECDTGGKLRQIKGSTCSKCYALRGNYRFDNVVDAQARRRAALERPDFVENFVIVLTKLYASGREDRFRWFDAGDLPNVETLQKIVEIARQTPHIRHWLPTRELSIVRGLRDIPANLTIRLSAAMIGDTLTPFEGMTWSGVNVADIPQCPAPQQGNKCGSCSMCWGKEPVSYHLH
jgi:hypothetical protein